METEAVMLAVIGVATTAVGGPHLWSWLKSLMAHRRAEKQAEREAEVAKAAEARQAKSDVAAAEARILARLDARVSHLELENARLHEENRELRLQHDEERRGWMAALDERDRELQGVRLAYAKMSEEHEALIKRVKQLETTLQTLNDANASAIHRAIERAVAKRMSED